jgi:transcriptional regulator with XRE-family HTH domain
MPMTAKQRKIALIEAEVTMAEIAREMGVSGAHISQIIAGTRRSPRIEAKVAEVIGVPAEEVFGCATTVAA